MGLLPTVTTQKPGSHSDNSGISHVSDSAIGQGHRSSPVRENACQMHGLHPCRSYGSLAEGADVMTMVGALGSGGVGTGSLEAEGL